MGTRSGDVMSTDSCGNARAGRRGRGRRLSRVGLSAGVAALVFGSGVMIASSSASATTILTTDLNSGLTPEDLVDALVGSDGDAVISNVSYAGASIAAGTFSGGSPLGLDGGVILSSGDIANVIGPNELGNITANNGLPGDVDLDGLVPEPNTNDASVLQFDFECGAEDVFSFEYVFASDEYNEFTNSAFNDVFGFFLNGANIALLDDGVTPVSVNTVNGGNPLGTDASNPELFVNNDGSDGPPSFDTEADGFTVKLAATAAVTPGSTNTIKLAVADTSDFILDSWVLLESGSFDCAPPNEPPVADAGEDETVEWDAGGNVVTLDGTGSSDPDDDPLTYSWSISSGPTGASLDDATSATPELSLPGLGTWELELVVNDGEFDSEPDQVTVVVEDTTAPVAECLPSVNPNGKKPQAPGNGGQGQNQDGFYVIDATDSFWPADTLQVSVTDSGSGIVFGPYDVGTVIKYTEDADATPEVKTIGGPNSAVDWHIIGNGDAEVTAVDGSGNVSEPVDCLVPPAPK